MIVWIFMAGEPRVIDGIYDNKEAALNAMKEWHELDDNFEGMAGAYKKFMKEVSGEYILYCTKPGRGQSSVGVADEVSWVCPVEMNKKIEFYT